MLLDAKGRELLDKRHEFEAELRSKMMAVKGVLDDFNYELKQIDPYLELVRAGDQLTPGTPLKPGYYHVIRHNPGAPPSVMTVEGPAGEFIEPNSSIFDMLRAADLQNPEVGRDRRRHERELELAKERRENRERKERQEEILERWKSASQTHISMNCSSPWSQNQAGRRGSR